MKKSNFPDFGQQAADAAEKGLYVEVEHFPIPENIHELLQQIQTIVAGLDDRHGQKAIMQSYLNAASRCLPENNKDLNGQMNIEGLKLHLALLKRQGVHISAEAIQLGRTKAGESRKAQLLEQGEKKRLQIIEAYNNSELPEKNRAAAISKKLGVTSIYIRQVIKKAKPT